MNRPKLKNIAFIVFFLLATESLFAHPIKMSTGKLQIDTQAKTCELVINFFINDFEPALLKIYPQPPFNYKGPSETMKESILDYIRKNIDVRLDDQSVKFNLQSIREIEDNVCQVTLTGQFPSLDHFDLVTVKNTLLFDSFAKQSNIIRLVIDQDSPKMLQFFHGAAVRVEKM